MTQAPKIVAYLAHPVGAGVRPEDLERRQNNLANTLAWLQFLVDVTSWAISVPWLPYVQRLDEGTYRARGIADDLACLERCDILVAVGGQWSPGMQAERRAAEEHAIPIVDLTSWGFAPPAIVDVADLRSMIALRTRIGLARPRRVWLPPLEVDDVGELKGNRSVLRAHAVDHGVIDRILEAVGVLEASAVSP